MERKGNNLDAARQSSPEASLVLQQFLADPGGGATADDEYDVLLLAGRCPSVPEVLTVPFRVLQSWPII